MFTHPQQFELVVTQEDYNRSAKDYFNTHKCPLAIAVKRMAGVKRVIVGAREIAIDGIQYVADHAFSYEDYKSLEANGTEKKIVLTKQ